MKKQIQYTLFFGMSFMSFSAYTAKEPEQQTLSKNGMYVQWYFKGDRIFFTMKAPTNGWVTIGFNTTEKMTNAYLLMGRVTKSRAEVVEHYTIAPGKYKPIKELGGEIQVDDVQGSQGANTTVLQFSLPVQATNRCQKDLSRGKKYVMVLAYSQADDFQHHSIMRTSVHVEL